MDWMNLDLEPVPWSISYDDGCNDDISSEIPAELTWKFEEEGITKIQGERVIIASTGVPRKFSGVIHPEESRSLVASIFLDKKMQMSLVDSSVGGIDCITSTCVATIHKAGKEICVDILLSVPEDRAFEIASLLFSHIETSSYIVLDELSAYKYISSNPTERAEAPLLRMLSTQQEGDFVCKALEVPNMIAGVPAALLSLGIFYKKRVDVYLSLTDGYQLKEESLAAFECVFPDLDIKDNAVYQLLVASLIKAECNNPLYT